MRHEVNLLFDHARRLAEVTRIGRELTRELSGTRFTANSAGGLVTAHVDHTSRVLAIQIEPTAPTRNRAGDLAAQTVQAVTEARAGAAAARRRLVTALGGRPGEAWR